MTYTRAEVIQSLVALRKQQLWSIRLASCAGWLDIRLALDASADVISKHVAGLERALRESTSDSFESE